MSVLGNLLIVIGLSTVAGLGLDFAVTWYLFDLYKSPALLIFEHLSGPIRLCCVICPWVFITGSLVTWRFFTISIRLKSHALLVPIEDPAYIDNEETHPVLEAACPDNIRQESQVEADPHQTGRDSQQQHSKRRSPVRPLIFESFTRCPRLEQGPERELERPTSPAIPSPSPACLAPPPIPPISFHFSTPTTDRSYQDSLTPLQLEMLLTKSMRARLNAHVNSWGVHFPLDWERHARFTLLKDVSTKELTAQAQLLEETCANQQRMPELSLFKLYCASTMFNFNRLKIWVLYNMHLAEGGGWPPGYEPLSSREELRSRPRKGLDSPEKRLALLTM